jgi:hypothetical protein
MNRDVFPRINDRRLIRAFLAGRPLLLCTHPEQYADIEYLGFGAASDTSAVIRIDGCTVAWFDTAGALTGMIAPGAATAFSLRALNFIMATLGQPEQQVTRDVDPYSYYQDPPTGREVQGRVFRYFFDGSPIQAGQPFVMAGPVGVLAYRASLGPSPTFDD